MTHNPQLVLYHKEVCGHVQAVPDAQLPHCICTCQGRLLLFYERALVLFVDREAELLDIEEDCCFTGPSPTKVTFGLHISVSSHLNQRHIHTNVRPEKWK